MSSKKEDKKKVIITLSKKFPSTHRSVGQLTHFKEKIINTFLDEVGVSNCDCCEYTTRDCSKCFNATLRKDRTKIHTIRLNRAYWETKVDKINKGEANLLLRQWSNIPYKDPQEKEFCVLDKIGYQEVYIAKYKGNAEAFVLMEDNHYRKIDINLLAKGDGLSLKDFISWFFGNKSEGKVFGCIIHFTDFRY